MARSRTSRGGERGQLVPLLALMAVVIFGATALAVDLSVQTHYRRNLQNVTDSASLAGARDLPITPTQTDRINAVVDALVVVHNSFPWTVSGATWAQTLVNSACLSLSSCSVTVAHPAGQPSIVVTVNVPPVRAADTSQRDSHHVEVILTQDVRNGFGGILGQGSGQDGGQSVAFHQPFGLPFGFALFSKTYVAAGNQHELIKGDVYADRYVQPQASGHSTVCADIDPYGNPGYVILGALQEGDSGYDFINDPGQANTPQDQNNDAPIVHVAACGDGSLLTSGTVDQTGTATTGAGCSGVVTGVTFTAIYNNQPRTQACEAKPALLPPAVATFNPPTGTPVCGAAGKSGGVYQPGVYQCSGTNKSSLVADAPFAQGIYGIIHNTQCTAPSCYDVDISGSVTSFPGVTFYLEQGATIGMHTGTTITQTPFNDGSGSAGTGRYLVASDGTQNPTVQITGQGTNTVWSASGVIWIPTGTVSTNNKGVIELSGQAVVGNWNVTSGDHPNPDVTFNAGFAPSQLEILRLSE